MFFLVNFAKSLLRTSFLTEHFRWLPLQKWRERGREREKERDRDRATEGETERQRQRDRQRQRETEREQNLAKQFTLHSAEAYSEPFPTSKLGGYLTGGKYFHKNIHLRCLKRFCISCCLVNHKNKANTNHMATLKQASQPLENLWNIPYNGIK